MGRFTERSFDQPVKTSEELQAEYESLMELANGFWVAAQGHEPQSRMHIFLIGCAQRTEKDANNLSIQIKYLVEVN